MLEALKEFYFENKAVIDTAVSGVLGAAAGWLTSLFRTRKARLEQTFDGLKWYDEDDLVYIDGNLVPLNRLTIVKKGKNANED